MEKEQTPEEIVVVYAADENVAIGLYVSIFSLLHNVQKNAYCHVYIIDGGLSSSTREKIQSLFVDSKGEASFIKASTQRLAALPNPRNVGRAAYLLLLVPELMKGVSDKAIYLDSDTIVLDSISKLYDVELGECIAGAVKEYVTPTLKDTKDVTGLLNLVGFDPSRAYINSGVLVINIDHWCEARVTEKSIQLLSDHHDVLTVDDQDAVNGVIEKWTVLDPRWNVQLHWLIESQGYGREKRPKIESIESVDGEEDLLRSPGILHFNHHPKPWQRGYVGPYQQLYFEYLSLSGWFGNTYEGVYRLDKLLSSYIHKKHIKFKNKIYDPVYRKLRSIKYKLKRGVSY